MEADVAKWCGTYSRAAAIYFLNRPEVVEVSDFYIGVVDVAPWIPADHPMLGSVPISSSATGARTYRQ
jgi:protein O-GlcNAc transferase